MLIDSKTNQKLFDYLESDDDVEVLFALDHIKNYDLQVNKIIPLLNHKSVPIKMASWEVFAKTMNSDSLNELIIEHFNNNSSKRLRQKVYYLLAENADKSEILQQHISDEYPDILESILEAWAVNKNFELSAKIKDVTNNYLNSSSAEIFNTGLRLQKILPSNAGKNYVANSLESIDDEQQRSAVFGSIGFLETKFISKIVGLLHKPLINRTVRDELIQFGDNGLQYYLPLLKDDDDINTSRFIQVMEKTGSERAVSELVGLLRFRNPDLRKSILEMLIRLGPERIKPNETRIEKEFFKEIELAKEILSVFDLNKQEFKFLSDELIDLIQRVFRILSLLYEPGNIKRIEDGVFSYYSDRRANSIEALNNTLIQEHFKQLEP